MGVRCIHAMVTGRVQGVFFRDNTQKEAQALNIVGWVRNNPDGTVELTAKGDEGNIDTFIKWLGHGPDMARVDDLSINNRDADKYTFRSFEVTS